jgi:ABC-type transport system substrate-binding protein
MTALRSARLLVALSPACALLSACSLIPADAVQAAPAAKSGARTGGSVTVGITRPGGIDPVNAYEPIGKLISSTMCDTVAMLDPDTAQVREGLAKSMVFSPDGTTLTFKMRRNVRFNDGSLLKPEDVDFSYALLNARSTASYVKDLIAPFAAGISSAAGGQGQREDSVLADDVVGGKRSQPIAQALNEADFQMFANKGNGGAIRALAEPALAPISESAYRRDPIAFARQPVCVGPYKLAKPYLPTDTSISLVRTAGYYAQNVGYTGGGRGYLDTIEFKIFQTADLAYAAYAKGVVDVVAVPRGRADDARRFGAAVVSGRATDVEFIGVPTGLEPFSSTDLRRALSLALDRTALSAALGQAYVPADGFLPAALAIRPGDNGIRTGAVQAKASTGAMFDGCSAAVTPAHADVAAATAALARAEATPGAKEALAKPMVLYVNTDGRYEAMARLVARQWKDNLGLTVEVKPLRWADYLQKASQGPGFDGAFHLAWAADATAPVAMFNDVQTFLGPVFTASGTSNWAHWSSTDFDFAFAEDAARASDVRERGVLFKRLERMLCRELPMMPVSFGRPQYLVRSEKLATARTSFLAAATGMPLLREIYQR